ncbi:polysaccharide biosynthesis tyrosine autokinase [Knoellia sp. LjRoot47]|uniref:polysaccharide biosynthesis tyrosine autokinase n=1 Tax=Knoellia sp. LjRoot47 TaxID=3342330 RepID=UPI003ECDD8BB
MSLFDYVRVLRKRWVLIAVLGLLGAGAGAVATQLVAPRYEARAELFVGSVVDPDGSQGSALQSSEFTMQRIRSYARLVDSPLVLNPVIEQLDLGESRGQLAARTSASSPPDTVLLVVSVEDADAARSADITNAVATQLAKVIQALESSTSGAVPVKLTVVQPASTPEFPTQPRPRLNQALGLVAGLTLGLVAAVLREALDTSVRSAEEVDEITGTATLARVPYSGKFGSTPAMVLMANEPLAEPFRRARTNIHFASVDSPVLSLAVTSSVASEGKTTTSLNLALAFAQAGSSVVLIEGDLRRPMLTPLLRMGVGLGLTDVIAGQATLPEVLQDLEAGKISFIGHGTIPPNPSELLASKAMSKVLADLRDTFDVVIVDTPPLLPVVDAAVVAGAVDGTVLVARYGAVTRQQLARSVASLEAGNARLLGTVHTFVPDREPGYTYRAPVTELKRSRRRGIRSWFRPWRRAGRQPVEETG